MNGTIAIVLDRLTRPALLWILFILSLALTASFVFVGDRFGFRFIDSMSAPGEVLAYVGALTPQQKLVHAISTATLDVVYPFAYGGLLAGLTLRYWHTFGRLLILPAILVIPADLIEGVVQIFILNGEIGLVGMKSWLTPLKYGLFFLALAIALVGMFKTVIAGFRT